MLKKVKNTLAILLAVCFLMSVTAAAVSAAPSTTPSTVAKPLTHSIKPLPNNIVQHKGHLVTGHWETKSVKTIVKQKVFINHHWKIVSKVVYKTVKFWVPAHWVV